MAPGLPGNLQPSWTFPQPCTDAPAEPFGTDLSHRPESALPHNQHTPSGIHELRLHAAVTPAIAADFLFPEFSMCSWPPEQVTPVSMPEAAIDQDDSPVSWKYKIRLARQSGDVPPVPETGCMQPAAHKAFGSGTGTADARHHPAADCGRYGVSH